MCIPGSTSCTTWYECTCVPVVYDPEAEYVCLWFALLCFGLPVRIVLIHILKLINIW